MDDFCRIVLELVRIERAGLPFGDTSQRFFAIGLAMQRTQEGLKEAKAELKRIQDLRGECESVLNSYGLAIHCKNRRGEPYAMPAFPDKLLQRISDFMKYKASIERSRINELKRQLAKTEADKAAYEKETGKS
jgi:hypothetical protein